MKIGLLAAAGLTLSNFAQADDSQLLYPYLLELAGAAGQADGMYSACSSKESATWKALLASAVIDFGSADKNTKSVDGVVQAYELAFKSANLDGRFVMDMANIDGNKAAGVEKCNEKFRTIEMTFSEKQKRYQDAKLQIGLKK